MSKKSSRAAPGKSLRAVLSVAWKNKKGLTFQEMASKAGVRASQIPRVAKLGWLTPHPKSEKKSGRGALFAISPKGAVRLTELK